MTFYPGNREWPPGHSLLGLVGKGTSWVPIVSFCNCYDFTVLVLIATKLLLPFQWLGHLSCLPWPGV